MTEAFVYCWTDHHTKKLYVGVRKGSPDDGYICSSKVMMEEYTKRSADFTRQILATGTWDDMLVFESKILKAAGARKSDHFYNLSNGFSSDGHPRKWETMTDEQRRRKIEKTRKKMAGRAFTESHKAALRGKRPHVNQAGGKNNNAQKVETPFGNFDSIRDAATSLGWKYAKVYYKISGQHEGWKRIPE